MGRGSYATQNQALAGLFNITVVFIACLFIVSASLEMTRPDAWAGKILISKAGQDSRTRLIVIIMAFSGALSALVRGGGAVAALPFPP